MTEKIIRENAFKHKKNQDILMKEASVSSISTDLLIQSLSFILDLLILVDLSIDYSGLYCTALEEYACS